MTSCADEGGVLCAALVCIYLPRCVLHPEARTAIRAEVLPLSADFPRINPAFAGRPEYRCAVAKAFSGSRLSTPPRTYEALLGFVRLHQALRGFIGLSEASLACVRLHWA
jgi:hypothetical protein